MNDNDIISCLANVLAIAGADEKLAPREREVLELIRQELGADSGHMEQAIALAQQGNYAPTPAGRFSDQVRNLEDMLRVAMADNELALEEKREILDFARKLRLTQDQINGILTQTKALLKSGPCYCRFCGTALDPLDQFCPECGSRT